MDVFSFTDREILVYVTGPRNVDVNDIMTTLSLSVTREGDPSLSGLTNDL